MVAMAGYFTTDRWAISHTTMTFHDVLRDDRNVTVEVAVRRDRQMQAAADMSELPVAILSHGNTRSKRVCTCIARRLQKNLKLTALCQFT